MTDCCAATTCALISRAFGSGIIKPDTIDPPIAIGPVSRSTMPDDAVAGLDALDLHDGRHARERIGAAGAPDGSA